MWDHVIFYLNGKRVTVGGDDVFLPLVEFLRDRKGLRGTKVGCAEGDCGACTVLVGVPEGGTIRYRPATSCIRPLHQLDGTHVVTIEGLTPPDGTSPVQQAMIDHHGSQCGFCTPGFVVAIEGVLESGTRVDDAALRTGLAGNLCRCTGYLPILDAAMAADAGPSRRLSSLYPPGAMYNELAARAAEPILIETGRRTFFRPTRVEDAVAFKARHPGAVIVSGGTELGVQRNKQGREPSILLSLTGLDELARIDRVGDVLSVGAGATWAQLEAFSRDTLPEIHAMTRRFGSPQIRNVATLAGNIAHGSPVADSLCLLLVLGAELELMSVRGTRRVPIEDLLPRAEADRPRPRRAHRARPDPAAGSRGNHRAVQDLQAEGDGRLDLPRGRPDRPGGRPDRLGRDRFLGRRPDRPPAAPDRGVPGRPAVLRGDLPRGRPARPGRGRADLRRPRLARLPPPARREYPAEVLSRGDRGRSRGRRRPAGSDTVAMRTAGPRPIRSGRDRSRPSPSPSTTARSAGRCPTSRRGRT